MPVDLLASQPKDLLAGKAQASASQSSSSDGSVITSAAAGFNQGVENFSFGIAQLATKLVDNVIGTNMSDSVNKVKSSREQAQNSFEKDSPIAFAVGKGVGSIAAVAPTLLIPGAGAGALIRLGTQGLAQGAVAGALMYTDDGTVSSHLSNAAMMGAVGGAIGNTLGAVGKTAEALMKPVATYQRGLNAGKEAAKTFIDDVTTGVGAKLNPSNIEITSKNVLDAVNSKFDQVNAIKNANYAARDQAAMASGVDVPTPNVNEAVKGIRVELGVRQNSDDRALLNVVNAYAGEKPITMMESYNLLKKVGNARTSAMLTDPNKARLLGQVQDALQLDVDKAVYTSGNQTVQSLHDTAQNFYKETYLPIQQVAKSKAVEKLTDDAWVAKLVNDSKTQSGTNDALNQIGGDIKNQIAGAHMNAVKSSLVDPISGVVDFNGYVSALNSSLLKNPAFSNIAAPIGNLAKVVDAVKKATMDRGQGLSTMAATGLTATGNPIAAGLTWLAGQSPKAQAVYTLGKISESPQIQSLLAASKNIDTVAEPVKKALLDKIGGQVGAILSSKGYHNLSKGLVMGTGILATSPNNTGSVTPSKDNNKQPDSVLVGIRN